MTTLPKVLLLGDSIRMSYQALVAEAMRDRAEVVGPSENCQFSAHTLGCLERWLEELGSPDLVHWNNGIHDVGHNPERTPVQFPLDTYVANLKAILAKLRETGATVVWATSTPVHSKRPFVDTTWSWRNEEIDQYNAAALELMQAERVPVNDLHAVIGADVDLYLADDYLHLSEAGKQKAAEAVVSAIGAYLGGQSE